MLKRLLKIGLFLTLLAYVGFCATVYFWPQLFFYDPTLCASSLENARANGFAAQRVEYRAADGTELYGWYISPKSQRPLIVFLHGNSYNIEKFYHKLQPFVAAGYGILLPEYRGFGDVKGTITQAGLEQDALAALDWLRRQGYANRDIYIYGMSLGSYTATYSAHTLGQADPFAGVILEVPFDSMYSDVKDLVWFPLPLKLIMRDKYNNMDKIAQIRSPLLIMGGGQDTLVPVNHAEALFAAANEPKKMIVYPKAKHGNLYDFANYRDILNWLQEHEKNRS